MADQPKIESVEQAKQELARLAKEALEIQDACNLSAVVHTMSRAVSRLWDIRHFCDDINQRDLLLPGKCGTESINQHPIVKLYISKLMHLAEYTNQGLEYSDADNDCSKLIQQGCKHPGVVGHNAPAGSWKCVECDRVFLTYQDYILTHPTEVAIAAPESTG